MKNFGWFGKGLVLACLMVTVLVSNASVVLAADMYAGRPETAMVIPAIDAVAVTPHDTNDLAQTTRALYIGGAGNVKLITISGNTVTFTGLPAGTLLPIRATRIFATDTTATGIVNLF